VQRRLNRRGSCWRATSPTFDGHADNAPDLGEMCPWPATLRGATARGDARLGADPEEVCLECPELLEEVRARWRGFCLITPTSAYFPEPATPPERRRWVRAGHRRLAQIPGYEVKRCSAAAAWRRLQGPTPGPEAHRRREDARRRPRRPGRPGGSRRGRGRRPVAAPKRRTDPRGGRSDGGRSSRWIRRGRLVRSDWPAAPCPRATPPAVAALGRGDAPGHSRNLSTAT